MRGEKNKRGKWTIQLSAQPLIMILPGLFYLANLIRMLMITSVPYFITLYVVGVMGILAVFFVRRYDLGRIVAFFLLYEITLVLNWIVIGNISLKNIAVNVFLIGITLMMLVNQWTYREGIIVFYATALIMIYKINTSSYRRILVSSTNYISILMILSVSFYYIALERDGRKLKPYDLIPALICFFMSVWGRGRGGILSTAVLVALMLFLYIRTLANKRKRFFIFVMLILLMIGIVFLVRNINPLDAFMSLGKWETRGTDNSARTLIWSSYFSKMNESISYILMGPPLNDIPIIYAESGNCHNSFLQLHAYNGLLMFVVFSIMLVRVFIHYWKKRNFVSVAILAVLVLRGMTDKFIFGQYGMPIILFLVLYPLIEQQQASNEGVSQEEQ